MKPIDLAGFEATFAADPDPWRTFHDRDEAAKRQAILTGIGPGPWGRVLELAAGNGSNSVAMAVRSLRLDATEATANGTRLVRDALADRPRARAIRLAVPARLPRIQYDVVVVAELLYYLSPLAMRRVARDVAAALRPGGVLVLAHHRIDFHDFAQHAEPLHGKFMAESGVAWRCRTVRRNRRWRVETCRRM